MTGISRLLVVSALVLAVAGCGSARAGSGAGLTGLGATTAAWNAHHDGGYSSIVTNSAGLVEGYVVTMTPLNMVQATSLIEGDLPPDVFGGGARLEIGIEGTQCEILDFTSPTLGKALGGKHGDLVMVAFQSPNATSIDLNKISHAVVASGNEELPEAC